MFLDLIPNQEITTIQTTNHEIHHTIGIETTPIIEIEVIQTTETRITRTINQGITHIIDRTITDQTTIIKIDREIIHKIDTQVIIIVIEIIPNHHTGIIITIIILIIRHRSSTPKHQRQINQVQSNPETTSDPPGIDDTVTDTLQLNQINCTSSDSESDTENTLSINMIKVENDYESVIYEQPFSSHIYENQSEFLQNYYTTPITSTLTTQETNEINTTNQTIKNTKTKCLNTNHIYQNIQKEQPKEKIWTIPFLLESPRNKEFQPPDLEIDFLIDSGAESNIINIPTWNEIKTLHPKLTPLETSSKLATAQGSTLINYGKIQLFLLPTRTMEQSKILNKPFKQIFHITDIKYNIIGIPFISKYIPTINILNSKILIKDKYTKNKRNILNIFSKIK